LEHTYLDENRVLLKYRLPLAEVVTDFYDELKGRSSGFASFDYEEDGYDDADLVKVKRKSRQTTHLVRKVLPMNFVR